MSGLDQHYGISEIIAAIEGIKYPKGGTNTGEALMKAKEALFDKSARAGVPNIACVLTDGKSRDDISDPAQKLRDSGVTVFSVGIGKHYDLKQLEDMATDPDSQHVFKGEFDALSSQVESIVDTACKGTVDKSSTFSFFNVPFLAEEPQFRHNFLQHTYKSLVMDFLKRSRTFRCTMPHFIVLTGKVVV